MRRCTLVCLALLAACRGVEPGAPRPSAVDVPAGGQPIATASDAEPTHAEPEPTPEAPPDDDAIHGRLTEVDGQPVLHVWGTPQQMGFAHGALLRERILEVFDNYVGSVFPPATIAAAGPLYGNVAQISDARRAEAEGIVAGMKSAGGAEVESLGRELTANDLLVVNAMTDLVAIGCSSLSAWGAATEADAELSGQAAIVRNLDWSTEPALLRNQVLIAYEPSEAGRQRVVSVGFAGYIGCLSCINEAGVTALFNMGYGDGAASMTEALGGFAPANLMLRDAMETRDVDGDGETTAADIEAAVREAKHAGSWILHVLEPKREGEVPARILEVEADGVHRRDPAADTTLGPDLLAATNHLRGKEGPQSCDRYERIESTAKSRARTFDRDALWSLGASVRLPSVVHTMLVEPAPRRLTLWLRRPKESRSSKRSPTVHTYDALFER